MSIYRALAGAVAGLVIAATVVAPASAAGVKITMPALTGRYPVGTIDLHLVDHSRPDPWRPDRRRELMVTVTYPAQRAGSGQRAPWMAPGVAATVDAVTSSPLFFDIPPGSVDWASVRRQPREGVAADRSHGDWPVVLFSPGLQAPRELGAGLTDDLASRGYVVVAMSHTFETAAVEFPGGRVEHGIAGEADLKRAIDARVADTRFVLDQLTRPATLPRGLAGALDLSRIGMFGHSYGGFTAGEAMVHDRRIDAGINVDGAMRHDSPGEIVTRGLDRPFMLMGSDFTDPDTGQELEHSHVDRRLDPTWGDFWPNQRGWKRDLHLDGSTHYGLTDFQFAVPQLDTLLTPAKRAQLVGTIDPARSLAAQHDYLAGFFDLHLKGRDRYLFNGDSPCHPDVRFIG